MNSELISVIAGRGLEPRDPAGKVWHEGVLLAHDDDRRDELAHLKRRAVEIETHIAQKRKGPPSTRESLVLEKHAWSDDIQFVREMSLEPLWELGQVSATIVEILATSQTRWILFESLAHVGSS